jgi:hypothetical protein
VTAQAMGPQVEAKAAMKRHANTIITMPIVSSLEPSGFSSAK